MDINKIFGCLNFTVDFDGIIDTISFNRYMLEKILRTKNLISK